MSLDITKERALEIAREAALSAGSRVISIAEEGRLDVTEKSLRNPVTRADLEAESIILEVIRRHCPDHAILSEESSPVFADLASYRGPMWIIDPLDGTSNYAFGIPHVGVSIAFASNGQVQAGLVYAPFTNETFSALRGCGSQQNGRPIGVRRTPRLVDALVGTGFPYSRDDIEPLVSRARAVLERCRDLRRFGAASLDLCYVACGRLDAYYETVCVWDMAAGGLIVREAGGRMGHFEVPDGAEMPPELDPRALLAASPEIFGELQALLAHPAAPNKKR